MSKIQTSHVNLMVYLTKNIKTYNNFIEAVDKYKIEKNFDNIKKSIEGLRNVSPFPNLIILNDEDFFSTTLNLITKIERDNIEELNNTLEKLFNAPDDINLISRSYANIILVINYSSMLDTYRRIVKTKFTESIKIYGSKIDNNKIEEMVNEEVREITLFYKSIEDGSKEKEKFLNGIKKSVFS